VISTFGTLKFIRLVHEFGCCAHAQPTEVNIQNIFLGNRESIFIIFLAERLALQKAVQASTAGFESGTRIIPAA
jgi:hypothetical protein